MQLWALNHPFCISSIDACMRFRGHTSACGSITQKARNTVRTSLSDSSPCSASVLNVTSQLTSTFLCYLVFFISACQENSFESTVARMDYVYVAKGDLDAAGVKANLSSFSKLAAQKEDVTIDMSAVESIDGSGIGALVFVYKRLRSVGCHIKVTNVKDQPLSLLKELGIANILLTSLDSATPVTRAADGVAHKASTAGSDSAHLRPTS